MLKFNKILEQLSNYYMQIKIIAIVVFLLLLFVDIFVQNTFSNMDIFLLTIYWLLIIVIYKFSQKINLIIGTIMIFLAFLLNLFNADIFTEKLTSWFFIFILIFLIQGTLIKNKTI